MRRTSSTPAQLSRNREGAVATNEDSYINAQLPNSLRLGNLFLTVSAQLSTVGCAVSGAGWDPKLKGIING